MDHSNIDEVTNIIKELAQTEEEDAYLMSKAEKFRRYPLETVRSYIASALDLYRP